MASDIKADSFRPVARSERIENLDVLRGVAILAILLMNIPWMAGYGSPELNDPRLVSWTAADQATYRFVNVFLDGTQRGLLEMLFGAGVMIMTRAAMTPDGPVGIADLHFRRNLLLIALGVFQALVLFWPGDILMPYGIVAIFLFPFRKLPSQWKAALGAAVVLIAVIPGAVEYQARTELKAAATAAQAKIKAGKTPTKAESEKLKAWTEKLDAVKPLKENAEKREAMAKEQTARQGSVTAYATWTRDLWIKLNFAPEIWFWWAEIFGTMLLGAALFEWGVLQGRAGPRTYLAMIAVGYGVGVALRWLAVEERLRFYPDPKLGWITWDIARVGLVLGHIGAINLALRSGAGRALLKPFQASGKMPLTVYLSASLIGMVILFPGIGFGLHGKFGWAGMEAIALAVMAGQLVFVNLWMRSFETGPLEWAWKSLAYGKRQPFRKASAQGALAAAE